jgi:hypothetical protein
VSGIHGIGVIFALVALSNSSITHAASSDDEKLRSDLGRISHQRIFFGHQSVGVNLLDGIKQLSLVAAVPVRITEVTSADAVQPNTFGHTFVAENGNPSKKLKSFELAMNQSNSRIDVAFVKYCFVDINQATDVKILFDDYRNTIDRLQQKNPHTVFIHVTAPLTTLQTGLKSRAKQIFGVARGGTIENIRREEYNTLLRQTYQGRAPIFDLARIESTALNGRPESEKWDGHTVPTMSPEYTDDGGHLNATGRIRAARELVSILAAIPDRSVVAERSH